jgi:hypothetical protein
MRSHFFLLCVLGAPCLSLAQPNQASWTGLSALQAGQAIQIVDAASKKHSGTFLSVSDTAISYRETAGEHSIERQDVRTVQLTKNTHRLRNSFIGLGVGAGVGAAIGAASNHCNAQAFEPVCGPAVGAAVGVIFAVPGAVVGALVPSHKTVFNAP